jgi:conjugal transfer/entry exclusion protein
MANTKKTTSTEKVASTANADIQSLEKQVKEQQEQIKQLMAMLQNNVTVPKTENKSTKL